MGFGGGGGGGGVRTWDGFGSLTHHNLPVNHFFFGITYLLPYPPPFPLSPPETQNRPSAKNLRSDCVACACACAAVVPRPLIVADKRGRQKVDLGQDQRGGDAPTPARVERGLIKIDGSSWLRATALTVAHRSLQWPRPDLLHHVRRAAGPAQL